MGTAELSKSVWLGGQGPPASCVQSLTGRGEAPDAESGGRHRGNRPMPRGEGRSFPGAAHNGHEGASCLWAKNKGTSQPPGKSCHVPLHALSMHIPIVRHAEPRSIGWRSHESREGHHRGSTIDVVVMRALQGRRARQPRGRPADRV